MKRVEQWTVAGLAGIVLALGGCERFQPHAAPPTAAQPSEDGSTLAAAMQLTPPKVAETQVVARVNTLPITVQDFRQRTEELGAFGVDWTTLPSEQKEPLRGQLLEDLVRTELMAKDSIARGALRDAETQAGLWYLVRSFLARQWVQREQKALRVTQAEIEGFYSANKEIYKVPGRLRVRQVVVATEAEAKQVLRQLLDGASVAELAKTRSIAPDAPTGGDLGSVVRAFDKELYRRQGQELEGAVLFPGAEEVVFALEEGGISQIVKGRGIGGAAEAYYVYQVAKKEPSREKSLTEVQDEVKALLTLQKLNEKVGQLRNAAKADLYPDRLKDE